jgi:hypothetical protein
MKCPDNDETCTCQVDPEMWAESMTNAKLIEILKTAPPDEIVTGYEIDWLHGLIQDNKYITWREYWSKRK